MTKKNIASVCFANLNTIPQGVLTQELKSYNSLAKNVEFLVQTCILVYAASPYFIICLCASEQLGSLNSRVFLLSWSIALYRRIFIHWQAAHWESVSAFGWSEKHMLNTFMRCSYIWAESERGNTIVAQKADCNIAVL